ncbi:MAG: GGDEF domain-containing protein [Aliarcobacter sp.]|nr:GGDEF domain-containing protein [Aliarcobacter sp.]
MRYDISIIDDNYEKFKDFKNYSKSKLKNIHITIISPNQNNINEDLELSDLIIINIDFIDYFNNFKNCLKENVYTIFLINNKSDLDKISHFEKFDTLFKTFNYNELIEKIKYFTNNSNEVISTKKEEEFSNSIINNINYPIFSTDGHSIIFSNDHFFRLTDCLTLDELNSKYFDMRKIFIQEEDCFTQITTEWLEQTDVGNVKVCILDKNNKKKFFSLQKIFLTHNHTNIIVLNDISHEIEHKHELFKLLYTDNLTKYPNRTKLIEDLQNKVFKMEAVCLLNINSFKEVNDFFGHKVGDSILIDVAKLIDKSIQKYDNLKLYKFLSDSYCITNTKDSQDDFVELIKDIIDAVYKKVFTFEHYEIDIRMTAGISFSNKNNKLITADIALQSAKKRS